MVSIGDHVLGPPGVVRDELLLDIGEAIQAACAPPVRVRVVHLGLVAMGKVGLQLRAEIHSGIAAVIDSDLGLEFAVLALVQHIEKMAALAVADNLAVLGGPTPGIIGRFPAVQRFAVEHRDPSAGITAAHAPRAANSPVNNTQLCILICGLRLSRPFYYTALVC